MPPPPAATATATNADAAPERWMYVDAVSGQPRGPLPEATLKRLIRKGLLLPQQLVWTTRLSAWTAAMQVAPFQQYCSTWFSMWHYIVDADSREQQGPVSTQQLLALFLDGTVDGLTLVWNKDLDEWKPIAEVPTLKELVQEANEDQEREELAMQNQQHVAVDDQVFDEAAAQAFVAEDGKEYVFDAETKKWMTPQEKIEEDLDAFQEQQEDTAAGAGKSKGKHKDGSQSTMRPPALPVVPAVMAESTAATGDGENAVEGDPNQTSRDDENKKKKKKKKKKDKWRKSKVNTWVYVSGLPLDTTVEEVQNHFSKCGIIQTDLTTGAPRIKLYKNKDYGGLNGDASICFMKEASVDLAVQLLDKSNIRPEWNIGVAPAVFEQKGDEFVKRKKQKLSAHARVQRFEQEKALSWTEAEDGDRTGLRIVVLKHMFLPAELQDETAVQEMREDIQQECSLLGEVTKVTVFPRHAEGVAVVKFAASGSATNCIERMNGRYFAGRQIECHFWDGTDYTHKESAEEQKNRADEFNEWLNEGSSSDDDDEEEPAPPAATSAVSRGEEGVHAGRMMPALSDDDSGDDDDEKQG